MTYRPRFENVLLQLDEKPHRAAETPQYPFTPLTATHYPEDTQTIYCKYSDGSVLEAYFLYDEERHFHVIDSHTMKPVTSKVGLVPVEWCAIPDEIRYLFNS